MVPASKSAAKIRCLAEAEGMRDIVDCHLCIAQIFYGHLGPQLVEEIPKRSVFVPQFSTKRPHRDAEMIRDVFQARMSSQCREQIGAHLSRDADPVLQSIVQVVAETENRRVSDFVAELRGAVQPVRVKQEAVSRLPKRDLASDRCSVFFFGLGSRKRHFKDQGVEPRSHDVAVERDKDAKLPFDNETIEASVDRRMRQRVNGPIRAARLLMELKFDNGGRELVILRRSQFSRPDISFVPIRPRS